MMDSPFFGRVDFQYDGDEEPELFYIGIGNLSETAGSRPLVYDWRAPVSGLFYDYDKGPAAYDFLLYTSRNSISLYKEFPVMGNLRKTLFSGHPVNYLLCVFRFRTSEIPGYTEFC